MSETTSWKRRLKEHRYSQDERALQWKFEKEVHPAVDAFIDDPNVQSYNFGTYDLKAEPWRMATAISFRKYNLKIMEASVDGKTEITLIKQKMSKTI